MVKNRGAIGLQVFFLLMLMSSLTTLLMFTETKTINIKRQELHNAIIASALAVYENIEQGDKTTVLKYYPYELQSYISNPSTIPSNKRNEIIILMTSEYFPIGQRYKSVYLEKDKALLSFKKFLSTNLDLLYTSSSNVLNPTNSSNNATVKKLEIKEFFVHNAIPNWDSDVSNAKNDIKNNKTTSNHVLVHVEIPNMVKIGDFTDSMVMPIHIDTSITSFHSK